VRLVRDGHLESRQPPLKERADGHQIMEKKQIIVVGDGGHAHSVAEVAETAGFVVRQFLPISEGDEFFSGTLSTIGGFDLTSVSLALGLGVNFLRAQVYGAIVGRFPSAKFPAIVHSHAWVSTQARLGAGSVLFAHASAGASASTGPGAVINTGASLDHHGDLGEFASLAPGARTGGHVTIGSRSMIGLQSGILQGLSVGADTVIGAHSLVLKDIPSLCVAYGSPCQAVRTRKTTDTYY